jgi:AGCS family alanine or glycine:cation symporter
MTIIYLLLGIFVIIKNIDIIPSIFKIIIDSAFSYKSFGVSLLTILIMGIQRGIFSNEAGIGTGSIAASINEDNNIISSGYIQMLGVYITSFLICTITSIIVIISNYGILNINDPNGIEIALFSFNYHFGNIGNFLLIVLIILFAFSTILSAYYYGEVSLCYFNSNNTLIIKFLLLITIIIGSIISSSSIWLFIDLNMAILAIINIYAIYKLRNDIKT